VALDYSCSVCYFGTTIFVFKSNVRFSKLILRFIVNDLYLTLFHSVNWGELFKVDNYRLLMDDETDVRHLYIYCQTEQPARMECMFFQLNVDPHSSL